MEDKEFRIIPEQFINEVTAFTGLTSGPAYYIILIALALLTIFITFLVANFISKNNNLFFKISKTEIVADLMAQTVSIFIKIIGIVIALQILGAGALVGAVLGTAGVIGLGISFAFKDIIENYIAGVILSIKQPYFKGDLVNIEGIEGIIQRMTTRMTMIKSLDGNNISIPNAKVFKANIINYSINPQRRFEFKIGIMADGNPNTARRIGVKAMETMDEILVDPAPFSITESIGDSSIVLIFYGWVDQNDYDFGQVRSLAISKVKTSLEDSDFDIPDPSYILKIKNIDDQQAKSSKNIKTEDIDDIDLGINQTKVALEQIENEQHDDRDILDKGSRE